jgi:hypothetical protein
MRNRVILLSLIARSVRFTRVTASIAALATALLPAIPAFANDAASFGVTSDTGSRLTLPRDGTDLLDDTGGTPSARALSSRCQLFRRGARLAPAGCRRPG